MIDAENLEIKRTTIHRVYQRKDGDEFGKAEYSNNIFTLGEIETRTLKDRISNAFSKSKRFFKLEIEKTDNNSFYGCCQQMKGSDDALFIDKSKSIADLLAASHNKKTIPAGILLVIEGVLSSKHFVLVIKAELQEAFTIENTINQNIVKLINDLFLSPAKDFYKIGLIIEDNNKDASSPNNSHSCYMYDDIFYSGKRDLAEYFYRDFLGFITNHNDKLVTKNFHEDISKFIDDNVTSFEDKKGLRNAVNSFYRENTTGIVNPQEFAETHFTDELQRRFNAQISPNYPNAFTKDLSLVDRRLERSQIKLVDNLKIEGPADALDNVNIFDKGNIDIDTLRLQVEKGEIEQIITIKAD